MTPIDLFRRMMRGIVATSIAAVSSSLLAAGLPDTGQTACYTTSGTTDCVADPSFPRQDGSQGAAPAYTKLDAGGNPLDPAAPAWSCVRDEATGLVWETKTADAGLQGVAHRYAWYGSDAARNGGEPGGPGNTESCGNTLGGMNCTSENYVAAVNAANYCGAADWRLPMQTELLTLVHAGNLRPSIDVGLFQNTANSPYWSATPYALNALHAWGVHFGYGAAHAGSKSSANAVRLVRGAWTK